MIVAPFTDVNTLNGFIHKYHIDIKISVSSNNTDHYMTSPFTDTSRRWCSKNPEKPGEWIKVIFLKRRLFITHFILWSKDKDHSPLSWYAEGCKRGVCRNITVYNESTINPEEVFNTTYHGPFDSIRYEQTGPNWNKKYYFCIRKLDFFGSTSDITYEIKYNVHKEFHLLILILIC